MTVADPAGDAPAAGGRDGLPRRGFRRLAEQGPGLLEGPVPSQSPCLQPLTPVRAHLRQAMTSSSYAGNPRFGATVHLPYDICISLLSNAESIYILFIVNTMNVVFQSNVTGRH